MPVADLRQAGHQREAGAHHRRGKLEALVGADVEMIDAERGLRYVCVIHCAGSSRAG
jgi:hypothetical protein